MMLPVVIRCETSLLPSLQARKEGWLQKIPVKKERDEAAENAISIHGHNRTSVHSVNSFGNRRGTRHSVNLIIEKIKKCLWKSSKS